MHIFNDYTVTVPWIGLPRGYRLETIKTDFAAIKSMCKDWSYLNKGITFVLKNYETKGALTQQIAMQ